MSNPVGAFLNKCNNFVRTRLAQPCLLCGGRSHAGLLCDACADGLPRLAEARCPCCALPVPGGQVCGACLKRPPAFERVRAIFVYDYPANVLIHQLKYHGKLAVAAWLAERMAEGLREALADRWPDRIIPMPLHPHRLRERGFNQAALLAAHLAGRLTVRHDPDACRRVRDTRPQVDLPLDERRRNIRGSFACDADLAGQRVVLVDDVMTSGASLNELARAVRKAGAVDVEAWVAARTPHGR